jgi:alkane 1-monooxygenase
MIWYTLASLTPAVLLLVAYGRGGLWTGLALGSITVLVFVLDQLPRQIAPQKRAGRGLSITLALLHFPLLAGGVAALAGAGDGALGNPERGLLFLALGLFLGQVSNSNAHELIHAPQRWPRRLGTVVYVSLLHGHHVSAHLRVHHVHAATDADPNSARAGEGFWRYLMRAWPGEFAAGYRAETAHRARAPQASRLVHPHVLYLLGAALALLVSFGIAGAVGLAAHLALAGYAQLQLFLSDYVQHYGLRRQRRADGRIEPVGPQHSWNGPSWYSAAMMLNAPRHSDHHMRPGKPFPALELAPATMPLLPRSLPVMAVLALLPPVWRRIMDRRVAKWQDAA